MINSGSIFNDFLRSEKAQNIEDHIKSDALKNDIGYVMLRYMPDLFIISPSEGRCIFIGCTESLLSTNYNREKVSSAHEQLQNENSRELVLYTI